jgi:hypothetical protein
MNNDKLIAFVVVSIIISVVSAYASWHVHRHLNKVNGIRA